MPPADLARRLAAHGLTLVRERHETHGYVAEWRLDGLGAPARFARLEQVEAWASEHLKEKPMRQTYQMNQIVVSDALTFVEALPPASVPLFLFSPPYNLNRRPESNPSMLVGITRSERLKTKKLAHSGDTAGYAARGGHGKWRNGTAYDGYSDDLPHEEYVAWQQSILRACWRALPDNGAIYYNHKPRIRDGVCVTPLDYNPGLPLRQIVIWKRAGGVNMSPTHYCPMHEWICIFAKPDWRLRDKGASGAGDVWSIAQEQNTWHPAPFPAALAEQVLETVRPPLVCDPFSGSGTVAKAAKKFGIDFIGCDRNAAYVERANAELATVRRVTLRQRTVLEAVAEQEKLFDSEAA